MTEPTIFVTKKELVDLFHEQFYAPSHQTFYLGRHMEKSPLDLFIYQEAIWNIRPKTFIETGTYTGTSALFFANYMDAAGIDCHIISIDVGYQEDFPDHPRITYLTGSSTDPDIVLLTKLLTDPVGPVMVSLDSDHTAAHVAVELDIYAPMVTPGSILVVEDTNLNGHPVRPHFGPGPWEAVEAWLPSHPDFTIADPAAKYLFTFHTWLEKR